MLCDEVKELLHEYIYGELNAEKEKEVHEHISNCDNCRKNYEELKQLLIDNLEPLSLLKDSIKVPDKLSMKIENKIRNNIFSYVKGYSAVACLVMILLFTVPVAAEYLVNIPLLDKYETLGNSMGDTIKKEYEENNSQMVEKNSTMKGINFTVDAVIKEKDKTRILFTVKVIKGNNMNYAMPSIGDLGVITVQDQFGFKYENMSSGMTLKSVNQDGEVKGILDVAPIKFFSYKLNIRITSMETGEINVNEKADNEDLKYKMVKNKDVYGDWEVNLYLDGSQKNR